MDEQSEYMQAIMEMTHDVGPPAPYTLNYAFCEMVGADDAEQYKQVLAVWKRNGWECRGQIARLFDAKVDYSAIEGIGERRAPLMEQLMLLPYGMEMEPGYHQPNFFTAITGLPVECVEGEGDSGQGDALLAPPQESEG